MRGDNPLSIGRAVGVLIRRTRQWRARLDLQVETEGPIVDVEQVVLNPLSHLLLGVGLAAIAVDLRPAGNAGTGPARAEMNLDREREESFGATVTDGVKIMRLCHIDGG